ncbi:hypothetical protein JB92DRAFT_3102776 [Gautieria morchelliformis]|nr:hypothetical protein JB92DRAFT_3102776 [Gautieria morchelliformis]
MSECGGECGCLAACRARATPPGTTPGTCPKRHCFPTLSSEEPRSINSLVWDTCQERAGRFAGHATRHASIWEPEALKQALTRAVPHFPSIQLRLITRGGITVRTFTVLIFHGRDLDGQATDLLPPPGWHVFMAADWSLAISRMLMVILKWDSGEIAI